MYAAIDALKGRWHYIAFITTRDALDIGFLAVQFMDKMISHLLADTGNK